MRRKLAGNPEVYDKVTAKALNDKLHEPWTDDQKSKFLVSLKVFEKDFKKIEENMDGEKSYE